MSLIISSVWGTGGVLNKAGITPKYPFNLGVSLLVLFPASGSVPSEGLWFLVVLFTPYSSELPTARFTMRFSRYF